jgi:hypothetical protein
MPDSPKLFFTNAVIATEDTGNTEVHLIEGIALCPLCSLW